ncbi:MAG: type I-E CRISPR-associated protein Cas7/Cse4/CasC [Anaerolineales bacterium]|nr:type I-E CRISPR-associated protein Cas7/Cse4/CasC [Anaerolineales bacterium]
MFIELHMIQNFSPSNLNRDDTGNPKDCEFGGVRRARISSQCLKRAIRLSPVFSETTGVEVGTRTKWLIERCLRPPLEKAGKDEERINTVLEAFVPAFISKLDGKSKDDRKTAVLLYLSKQEVENIGKVLLDNWENFPEDTKKLADDVKKIAKDLVKEHKSQTSAPDIALFGRMLAEQPELGLDAACQVAHAISTHRVTMEMDFYTAVDDLNPEDTAGAGMMGFTGFDSACFYRYTRIDWDQLVRNLNGDADLSGLTVAGFLRAAATAVPSGKQTSFAANNPPSFLLAVVRQDGMAWSLANAFERPVKPRRDEGLIAPSVEALDAYWGQLCQVYGTQGLRHTAALALEKNLPISELNSSLAPDFDEWISGVVGALQEDSE